MLKKYRVVRAGLVALATFITGLLVYPHPPSSVLQFFDWAWLPGLQAILVGLGTLGINAGVQPSSTTGDDEAAA